MAFLAKRYLLLSAAAGAIACVCAFGLRPAWAASDNTLGMALMSASVNPGGTVAHGSGVTSAQREGTGVYLVTLDRSIANCTCTANIGGHDGITDYFGSYVATANCPGKNAPANTASVYTHNPAGDLENEDFHLIVFCPK